MRARLTLLLLLTVEAVAVWAVATHPPAASAVDWGDPLGWLRATDPTTATLVVGRGLLLVAAGGLLVSTVLAATGGAVAALPAAPRRLRRAGARLHRCAPGIVVHLVEAAVVVGVVAGAAGPATAAPPPRARVAATARALVLPLDPVRDGRAPGPVLVPDPHPAPVAAEPVEPAVAAPLPPGPPPVLALVPPPAADAWGRHRVEAGEHLWGIAEAVVRAHGSDDPAAVDRYWRALCAANRPHLASGDPDVLAVGEDLDLPPVA